MPFSRLFDYIRLTSPGITLLVMLTGFIGLWVAARGDIQIALTFWAILGIGIASAGASVMNNYYDRDIDRLMTRTALRPLPSNRIKPFNALLFGLILCAASVATLYIAVNPIASALSLIAILTYAYLYTVILKRRTPIATEIGGIAGALPPVIGWTAVKGELSLESLMLFAIMFFWQPPHFWSLALKYRNDYQRALIPTMPVITTEKQTLNRSIVYIVLLFIASLMPYFSGLAHRLYLFVSLGIGVTYLLLYMKAVIQKRDYNQRLFRFSIIYLSLLFIAVAVDVYIY